MDRSRQILTIAVSGLGIFGTLVLFSVFGGSFNPSKKVLSELPRLDLSQYKRGEYVYLDHPSVKEKAFGYSHKILVYTKYDGTVHVWNIKVKDGKIGMPDIQWWRIPYYDCEKFGPSIIDGKVDEALPIKCHDEALENTWVENEWSWDVDGNNLGEATDGMWKANGVIERSEFVFYKRS